MSWCSWFSCCSPSADQRPLLADEHKSTAATRALTVEQLKALGRDSKRLNMVDPNDGAAILREARNRIENMERIAPDDVALVRFWYGSTEKTGNPVAFGESTFVKATNLRHRDTDAEAAYQLLNKKKLQIDELRTHLNIRIPEKLTFPGEEAPSVPSTAFTI